MPGAILHLLPYLSTEHELRNPLWVNRTNFYVGGSAWKVDDKALLEHFQQFGAVVDARVIMDRDTGESRGFGFVTYESAEAAAEAREQLDGSQHEGRTNRVHLAKDNSWTTDQLKVLIAKH